MRVAFQEKVSRLGHPLHQIDIFYIYIWIFFKENIGFQIIDRNFSSLLNE